MSAIRQIVWGLLVVFATTTLAFAQQTPDLALLHEPDSALTGGPDTLNTETGPVRIITTKYEQRHLRDIEGTLIYAAKKTEVINVSQMNINAATNNARQLFGQIAGLNIWENDGAGLSLNIGGRGLSPHRSSNFNMRQNGYDMAADALGYPESYYTPPVEAIDRIEIVRGAASLQYGTQFGGLVNFDLKQAPDDQRFQWNGNISRGSWNFKSFFNSVGGTVADGKLSYFAYHKYAGGDGQRPKAGFHQHHAHGGIGWQPTRRLTIRAEYTHMNYLAQQPGGLTDAEFAEDPLQSNRERNWFAVNWNLANVSVDCKLSALTRLTSNTFGLLASRDALGVLTYINRADDGQQRDRIYGQYRNIGNETRLLHQYSGFGGNLYSLGAGIRIYRGFTTQAQGLASAGAGPDFRFLPNDTLMASEFDFPSTNLSAYAEHVFRFGQRFAITPGLRYEFINTQADGYYNNTVEDRAGNLIDFEQNEDARDYSRQFVLAGIGASFKPKDGLELYANFSQNYRAITFNDMRVVNPNFQVDPNLQDERGHTADLGFRGKLPKAGLQFDYSAFWLQYQDRIGAILAVDSALFKPYRLRTNVSDARILGLETYTNWRFSSVFFPASSFTGDVFVNATVLNAQYVNSENSAFEGNQVEYVPDVIVRTGLSGGYKGFRLGWQLSYTSAQYSDATNAEQTATAIEGRIPSYWVMDLTASYTYKQLTFSTSLNNLTNNMYFTRRATGYPGPGIIPAEGLRVTGTLSWQLGR